MIFDILIIALFLLSLAYIISQKKPANFPPGPFGLPFIGNLHQLGRAPHLTLLNKWLPKYGPIVGVNFGSYRTVCITGYKCIRAALKDPGLQGRPDMHMFHVRSDDVKARGLIFTEGQESIEQRKFTIQHLKDLGVSKRSFEGMILEEAEKFVTEIIGASVGEPRSFKNKSQTYLLQILWAVVAGTKLEGELEILTTLLNNCEKIQENNKLHSGICLFMPWVAKNFPKLSRFDFLNGELVPLRNFMKKFVEGHKLDLKNNIEPSDLIGAYLKEIEKTEDPYSSFYKQVGEKSLIAVLLDLFFAGSETSSNTIQWAFLYLALYPNVQEKFCYEIDQVIGDSRLPSLHDEKSMLYTQALVQEVLRISAMVPLAVFHSATQNVEFEGYIIPKDTMVLLNLHSVHKDKEYWGDPEVFRPERFLTLDKKSVVKHEAFFPFGSGRRICPGESLARNQIFLILCCTFQKYRVELDPKVGPDPVMTPPDHASFVLPPPDHKLVFNKRF